MVVDAIVHDPGADHQLATEPVRARLRTWGDGYDRHVDAEWVAKEQERRAAAKAETEVYEPLKDSGMLFPFC